jgi:predicted NBD/HSP70 family sugar kinase
MRMKASTETLRRQSRALVLSALRTLGPASHTDIAEWSGLSSATVSSITTELEQEQILERLPQESGVAAGRGRPRVLLRHNPLWTYVIAVRVTSESVQYSLVDYCGTLKDRIEERRPQDERDVGAFSARFSTTLSRLAQRSAFPHEKVSKISITSKGLVARDRPVLLWSAIFGNSAIDFEALLRPVWQAEITLINETRFVAQAVAEKLRVEKGVDAPERISTLSLGHSIGLGLASRDKARRISSAALPFGHMIHQPGGPLCRCGSRGCIEAFSGFYAILRNAFDVPQDTIPAKFIPLEQMDRIAAQARRGDRRAEYAFRQAGEVLGVGLSRVYSLYEPMPLTITGPGIRYLDLMLPALEANLANNLVVRFAGAPKISIRGDEGELIFQGNVQACLSDLDADNHELNAEAQALLKGEE